MFDLCSCFIFLFFVPRNILSVTVHILRKEIQLNVMYNIRSSNEANKVVNNKEQQKIKCRVKSSKMKLFMEYNFSWTIVKYEIINNLNIVGEITKMGF